MFVWLVLKFTFGICVVVWAGGFLMIWQGLRCRSWRRGGIRIEFLGNLALKRSWRQHWLGGSLPAMAAALPLMIRYLFVFNCIFSSLLVCLLHLRVLNPLMWTGHPGISSLLLSAIKRVKIVLIGARSHWAPKPTFLFYYFSLLILKFWSICSVYNGLGWSSGMRNSVLVIMKNFRLGRKPQMVF